MKKFRFLVLFLTFFIGISSINASLKTFERKESDNYGVNKHFKIDSHNLGNVKNTPLVDASEKVYDYASILTDYEENEVYALISKFIEKTNMDMVFVSIDMEYTSDSKNEVYASDFYDYNDFGIDFSNYSGVLLLRNNYSYGKYFDIYTFGDAQLYFDYNRLQKILDDIEPDFRSGNYLDGIKTFVSKCSSYYDMGVPSKYKNSYIDNNGFIKKHYSIPFFACLISSSVITLVTMLILIRKNKMVKKATKAQEYLDKASVNYTVMDDQFINSHTTHYTVSSSSGGSHGGSHIGSSGGGHSSGGGRHG